MKFEIKEVSIGLQTINRLFVYCDNGRTKHIDIWNNELKELQEEINLQCEVLK